jgi:hypothetical protein
MSAASAKDRRRLSTSLLPVKTDIPDGRYCAHEITPFQPMQQGGTGPGQFGCRGGTLEDIPLPLSLPHVSPEAVHEALCGAPRLSATGRPSKPNRRSRPSLRLRSTLPAIENRTKEGLRQPPDVSPRDPPRLPAASAGRMWENPGGSWPRSNGTMSFTHCQARSAERVVAFYGLYSFGHQLCIPDTAQMQECRLAGAIRAPLRVRADRGVAGDIEDDGAAALAGYPG